MKPCCIVLILVSLGAAQGKEWKPTPDFLAAVRAVESSNGQFVYGDNGQSLGDFQLSEAAWLDVNEWRQTRGMRTYSYRSVYNAFINRAYAANYLTILHGELTRKLARPPSHAELYAAYNMGLRMFAECGYQMHRVNATTREKARQIDELLSGKSL